MNKLRFRQIRMKNRKFKQDLYKLLRHRLSIGDEFTMSNNKRPFDVLDGAKEGNVLIKLKKFGGKETTVSGELQAFDKHLNIWLKDARVKDQEEGTTEFTKLFVRGDNVLFVSPE